MNKKIALFNGFCPNCGGPISDYRLFSGLLCENCIPEDKIHLFLNINDIDNLHIEIGKFLESTNRLKDYEKIYRLSLEFKNFKDFFEKVFKKTPWSAQIEWMKRLLKNNSFAITAPTGLGKTSFGILSALFLATFNQKSYIITPTTVLVNEIYNKISSLIENSNLNTVVLRYHSKLSSKEQKEFNEKLSAGDFHVLITTTQFLSTNFEKIKNFNFKLVFVDDVDAVLKSSKNIEKIINLTGITDEQIKIAEEIIKIKKQLVNAKNKEKLFDRLNKLKQKIEINNTGCLIVSTATGRPRGDKVKLFRELLNFEVGTSSSPLRNVVDVYSNSFSMEEFVNLIKTLGTGGLIFTGVETEKEFINILINNLSSTGLKAETYFSGDSKPEILEKFKNGEIDILIGSALYYGLLVRGLDLPEIVKYAIFTEVPKFKFNINIENLNESKIYTLLINIKEYVEEKDKTKVNRFINLLRAAVFKKERLKPVTVDSIKNFLNNLLTDEEFLERLKGGNFSIRDGYIYIPDVKTYIQASGRTSRMYAGGITKGISIVFVDDEPVFRGLSRQLKWYFEETEFKNIEEVNLKQLIEEIDSEREKIRKGLIEDKQKEMVKSVFLIVESPHKAETIAKFFGHPSRRNIGGITVYEITTGDMLLNITASKGHILDLVENEGYFGVIVENNRFYPVYDSIKKCKNCGHQFISGKVCPKCKSELIDDARERINVLQQISSEVETVLIGTDPDREGEKIAWDIFNLIRFFSKNVKRVEFHEITRRAIKRGINLTREINKNLVNAQLLRRIEDRWIGFKLSQILWKEFNNNTLSAGRVQTPVLGWIIERFDEHKNSRKEVAEIVLDNGFKFTVDVDGNKEKLEKALKEGEVQIETTGEEEREIFPSSPFSTDEMLIESYRRNRFSTTTTMKLAQDLFESGLITYHRTDSKRVSKDGINLAFAFIKDKFGEKLFTGREWEKEEKAHECIRPTKPISPFELKSILSDYPGITYNHIRLYSIIFNRFIASQMKPARIKFQKIKIKIIGKEYEFEIPVRVIDEGFTVILPYRVYSSTQGEIKWFKIYKKPEVLPYTQAEVIKMMKERGIGRPSTYAIILQKLLDRRYVIDNKGRLIPTKIGRQVYSFLNEKYASIVSENKTKELEATLDEIEKGKDYIEVLSEEYNIMQSIE